MAKFHQITIEEMQAFMSERKFRRMNIPGTTEIVFGKVVKAHGVSFSLRVYTSILPDGKAREKGKDAIRVRLFCKYEKGKGGIVNCGSKIDCKRVKGWAANLDRAIKTISDNICMCPKCGSPLAERVNKSDNSKFWGCITYFDTKCDAKGSNGNGKHAAKSPAVVAESAVKNPYRIPEDRMTAEQREVERLFVETDSHIVVNALPGTGKTSMCLHLSDSRRQGQRWQYVVFSRKNAAEGRAKFPKGIPVQTQHSFDARWIRNVLTGMPQEATKDKNIRIMDNVYPQMNKDNKGRKRVRRASFKLINYCKAYAIRPADLDGIKRIMDLYDFDLESDGEVMTVVENVSEALELSLPENCGHEYNWDDLLWWPSVLELEVPKFDVVLADEVQDFNTCQIDRLMKLAARGARIIAVGDVNQAVYRFRGADNDAIANITKGLGATDRGVVSPELTINFRCGTDHLEFVRQRSCLKTIKAHDGAGKGKIITDLTYDEILAKLAQELGGRAIA